MGFDCIVVLDGIDVVVMSGTGLGHESNRKDDFKEGHTDKERYVSKL